MGCRESSELLWYVDVQNLIWEKGPGHHKAGVGINDYLSAY
jgi:hypothetical protein